MCPFKFCAFKGIGGGSRPKKLFLFILIYVIALSFFFPKWGHMFLNYQVFSFYGCLSEGDTNKYRKNRIFWEIAFFCILTSHFLGIYWSKSANFGFGERYWCNLKILSSKFWNFDFSEFYDPSKLSILSKSAKILPFLNLIFIEKIYLLLGKLT